MISFLVAFKGFLKFLYVFLLFLRPIKTIYTYSSETILYFTLFSDIRNWEQCYIVLYFTLVLKTGNREQQSNNVIIFLNKKISIFK